MELARRQPAIIVAVGGPGAALAAKAASKTIPIVFSIAGDPVNLGLVASVNRPGGNATGVSTVFSSVAAKQLEALHEILPKATLIGCLVNPKNPNAGTVRREAQEAARILGPRLQFVNAGTEPEIDVAFPLVQTGDALVVVTDPLLIAGPINSPRWQHDMLCRQYIHIGSSRLLAGLSAMEAISPNRGI